MYNLGNTLPFSSKVYDPAGALVNATTATLTITLPDGSTAPGIVVTNPPAVTGTYTYPYVTTTGTGPGRYFGRWLFTMSTGQTTAYTQEFFVARADPGFILSLEEAKEHLNIRASVTTNDEEIRNWLGAVTEWVETKVGVCVPRTITNEVHDEPWGVAVIHLRYTPVISVTTMTPYLTTGTTYLANTLAVDATGQIRRLSGLGFTGGPFAITYQAGHLVIPAAYRQAAKIMLQGLWETQRGPAVQSFQGGADLTNTPNLGLTIARAEALLTRPGTMVGIA